MATPTTATACPQQKQSSSHVVQSCFSRGASSLFSAEAVEELDREALPGGAET
jgi:hypothetical protein